MLLPPTPSLPSPPAATEQVTYIAQTITPASDGIGTEVMVDGNRFTITSGTLRETNVFHSFEQFGLSRDQVADFQASAEVQNIVGRIVGGDGSTIDGLLRVTGSNANLFLVNPAGMVFGPNASFDIRGSFTASTSDRLNTGTDWWANWNSQLFTTPNDPNSVVFTVGAPVTHLDDAPELLSFGSAITLTNGVFVSGDLTVPGNDIFIAGGSITTGDIDTASQSGGTVTLVAIAGGIVTDNISTQGEATTEDDGSLRLEDGSVGLTSFGDIHTGAISTFADRLPAVTDAQSLEDFNAVKLTSTEGNITVDSILSGPGGISISLTNGVFVSGDLTVPGNDIFIAGGSITTGDINTASQPAGGTVTLVAIAGDIATGNISTWGYVMVLDDGSIQLDDGLISLNSSGNISTGRIRADYGLDFPLFDVLNTDELEVLTSTLSPIILRSSAGDITVETIVGGQGGIDISAPSGLFRAEGSVDLGLDFQGQTLLLPLNRYPELVTFLESQGLEVRDPDTKEPYATAVPVVLAGCRLTPTCNVPTSIQVNTPTQPTSNDEPLISIRHRGQSIPSDPTEGIVIQGSGSDGIPLFLTGPVISVANPQLFTGDLTFDPAQPQQGFTLEVSPTFRALFLPDELPLAMSGTVGAIVISPDNAVVFGSILNQPFVPPVVGPPTPPVVGPPTPPVVGPPTPPVVGPPTPPVVGPPTPPVVGPPTPPVVGPPTPPVVGPPTPPVVVTLILFEESSSSVVNRGGQGPTVSSDQANTPLLRIAEDALTMPCSASELTIAANGRYVLSGCEP
jgi:filamentous hemagglutinin family protein